MKISVERFTHDLFVEMMPLAQKAWDECSEIKKDTCAFHGQRGFVIEPFEERFLLLEDIGSLIYQTLRDDAGVLLGFAMCVLYQSLHHKSIACGNVDSFYIEPEKRGYVRSFIAQIEVEFSNRNVTVIGWPTTASGTLFEMLNTLGYTADDVVMEKQLCALPQP